MRILELLVAAEPLGRVLESIVLAVEPLTTNSIGSVLMFDSERQILRFGAAPHLPERLSNALDGMCIGPTAGACGTAAFTKSLVTIEDFRTDPRGVGYRDLSEQFSLRACWSQPVMAADGRLLGTFAMYYREPRLPNASEIQLIAEAAQLVALAVETDRGRSEKAETEARFHAVVKHAPVGIALVAPDGNWLEVNQKVCDLLGYSQAELANLKFADVTYTADLAKDLEFVRQMLAGERSHYSMEKRYVRSDGEVIWANLTVSLLKTADGKPDYFISIIEDITSRKNSEAALHESHNHRQRVLDSLFIYVGVLSPEGILLEVNDTALNRADIRREAVVGLPCAETHWLSHDEAVQDRFRQALNRTRSGELVRYDEQVRMSGESLHWVEIALAPLLSSSGNLTHIIASAVDITDRKSAEEQLREYGRELSILSRRLLDVQESERRHLARELHDEIGQLLTTVNLRLDAARNAPRGAGADDAIRTAMEAVDSATARVRDLSLELRPSMLDDLGLTPTLRWYVRKLHDIGVSVQTSLPDAFPRLPTTIETACFRITQEALTNAIRHADAENVELVLTADSRSLELVVRDDGCGFDLKAARRATLHGGRAGLLGMTERAELAGGTLRISSQAGAGTTVKACFDLAQRTEPDE